MPYSPEYSLADAGESRATAAGRRGGRQRGAGAGGGCGPAAAFAGGLAARPQRTPLWPLLLTLALLLFPLDVAVRRLTMTWSDVGRGLRAIRRGLRRGPAGPPAPSGADRLNFSRRTAFMTPAERAQQIESYRTAYDQLQAALQGFPREMWHFKPATIRGHPRNHRPYHR